LVWAFREFPDEVLGIFRTTFFWFQDKLVTPVSGEEIEST
jgi:hypothetical protein